MSAITTAYYDLLGIVSLLVKTDDQKYESVIIHTLGRDMCLILHEINQGLLKNTLQLDPNVKKIRNQVKLYRKGGNKKVYEQIIRMHIEQYGEDIDNLGFYFNNDSLIGSTLYATYVFQNTDIFTTDLSENGENVYNFYKYVGEEMVKSAETLKEVSNADLPPFIPQDITSIDDLSYSYKDLHHEQIFKYEATTNVLITRLLFTLQEAYTCVWLYNGISSSDRLDLNNYILLRLLSIKADEIMDNLNNIQSFLQDDFNKIDLKCNYKLSSLISSFEHELAGECQRLRNMLHYNEEKTNFLDYIEAKHKSDSTYVKTTIESIVINYMEPLYTTISDYLNVENLKSMNDFEKIYKRLRTRIKSKMDKNN